VHVDVNDLLYTVARRSSDSEDLLLLLFSKLDAILQACQPDTAVVLASDGPGPTAKLILQRKRRAAFKSSGKREAFNPLNLTPGTDFSALLERALEFYACDRLHSWRRELHGVTFIVTGPQVPGEGELKLMACLHDLDSGLAMRGQPHPRPRPLTHLVVGKDADLILLAICSGKPAVTVVTAGPTAQSAALFSVGAFHAAVARSLCLSPGEGGGATGGYGLASGSGGSSSGSSSSGSSGSGGSGGSSDDGDSDSSRARATATATDARGIGLDFAALTIIACGNDYLPALQVAGGVSRARHSRPVTHTASTHDSWHTASRTRTTRLTHGTAQHTRTTTSTH
jgi:uncharacterized membrane protein YgcG